MRKLITTESSSSGGPSVSTELEYYENIGIQLNVLPQICDKGSIKIEIGDLVERQTPFSRVGGIFLRIKVNQHKSDCSNKNIRLAERLRPSSLAEISLR